MKYRVFVLLMWLALVPALALAQVSVEQRANELLERYKNSMGTDSPEYADAVQVCARMCLEKGDLQQVRELLAKSDRLFRLYGKGECKGRNRVQQIFYLDLLSQLEYEGDRDYYAVRYAKKSFNLKKKHFGNESYVTLVSALDLSKLMAERLNYRKSHRIHNGAFMNYVQILKREFCSISESERYLYWKTANKYIERTIQIANDNSHSSNRGGANSLSSAAYNAILLSKGILLNTTISFEEFIFSSGNALAIQLFNQKRALHALGTSQAKLDSIDYEILNALKCAGQEFTLPQLDITWQQVQRALGKDDVAIEFYRTDENNYGALIVKRGWRSPRIIRLSNEIQIGEHRYTKMDELLKQHLLDGSSPSQQNVLWNLSKAVWCDELLQYFPRKGKGRIFFSADANMQIAPLESFLVFNKMTSDNQIVTMSDCYDLYRISSTREICFLHDVGATNKSAVLYGGLKYDMSGEEMLAEHQNAQIRVEKENMANYIAQNRSLFIREAANITPLPGTKVEVKSIHAILEDVPETHIISQLGIHGTEETFKGLSGRSPEIIHIATHGFYLSGEERVQNIQEESTGFLDAEGKGNGEDDSMLSSGLLMSGAMASFLQMPIPDGVEDGILTSREISLLDLRNTQMAVLSACETALGEVTKDGVSGLQRGFKQAGTKSLLMSLWKVDDKATCTLMTEFYTNWIAKKMTKHDALEAAKKVVRETKRWRNPKYWAAFILLDALD